MFPYLIELAFVIFAIGLAGIASDRHFVAILLAVELILVASIIALVSFFTSASSASASPVIMLIAIWSVAATEIIVLITFYVYMKYNGVSFDITTLSKMKW
jgi:NADH:ubiquinone oxidoreductase subunit K